MRRVEEEFTNIRQAVKHGLEDVEWANQDFVASSRTRRSSAFASRHWERLPKSRNWSQLRSRDAVAADSRRFPAVQYSSIQRVPFAYGGGTPQYRSLEYVFPAAALLLALVYAFRWRISRRNRRLQLCGVFAFAGFLGWFPRPDIVHIAVQQNAVSSLMDAFLAALARVSTTGQLDPAKRRAWMGPKILIPG